MPFQSLALGRFLGLTLGLVTIQWTWGADWRTLNEPHDWGQKDSAADSTQPSEAVITPSREIQTRSASPRKPGFVTESGLISSPSTFSYVIPWGNNVVEDQPHPSFYVSPGVTFGYNFKSSALTGALVYYGAFDFYFGTLTSGPVFSRLQNPTAYVEYLDFLSGNTWRKWAIRFGAAHESNGMFIESREDFDRFSTAIPGDFEAQNFASMGWNYWLGEGFLEFKWGRVLLKPHVGLRLYTNQSGLWEFSPLEDSSLFYWKSQKEPHIWNFDGTVTSLTLEVPGDWGPLNLWPIHLLPWSQGWITAGAQLGGMQAGFDLFDHVSYHLLLKGRWAQWPWIGFLKYEYSYTQPIAYYSIPSSKVSVGIEFANFKYSR